MCEQWVNSVGAGVEEEEERLKKKMFGLSHALESEKYYSDLYTHILKKSKICFNYSYQLPKKGIHSIVTES